MDENEIADTFCLFANRMNEPRGFEYFPKEWEINYILGEKFIDFPSLHKEITGEKIPLLNEINTKKYTGFALFPEEQSTPINERHICYYREGELKYSQYLHNLEVKAYFSVFSDGAFDVIREYFFHQKNFFMIGATRSAYFKVGEEKNNLSINVSQYSKNSFYIEFEKKGLARFNLELNPIKKPSHLYYSKKIIERPYIFRNLSDFLRIFQDFSVKGYKDYTDFEGKSMGEAIEKLERLEE